MHGGGGMFSCTCNTQQRGTSIYEFFSILSLLIHFEMLLTYFICLFCAWEDLEYSKTMRICEPKINKWRLLKWGKTSLEKRSNSVTFRKNGSNIFRDKEVNQT